MKRILFFGLFLPFFTFSQEEFSFELYFEDAIGNKDTLVLGYDPSATDSIDIAFGEVNIISQPWSSVFEVRASKRFFNATEAEDTSTSQSKKFISSIRMNRIEFKSDNLPILMSWDSTQLVSNPEMVGSTFTNPAQIDGFHLLKNFSTYYIDDIGSGVPLNYTNDTTFYIHFAFGDSSAFDNLSIDSKALEGTLNIYPNPTSNFLSIDIDESKIENIPYQIFNSVGQLSQSGIFEKNLIDISKLTSGYYTISLMLDNQRYHSNLIISR